MQGSVPSSFVRAYRTYKFGSGGFLSLSPSKAHRSTYLRADSSLIQDVHQRVRLVPGYDFSLVRFAKWDSVSAQDTGRRTMRSCSFASSSLCSYRPDLTRVASSRSLILSGKSLSILDKPVFGTPRPVERCAAQWLSLQCQRGYARKPYVHVARKSLGQDRSVKGEEVKFKRSLSQKDSVTYTSTSDSSGSDDDDIAEDRKKSYREVAMQDTEVYDEESDSESQSEEEKDPKKDDKRAMKLTKEQKKTKVKAELNLKHEYSSEQDSFSESEDDEGKIMKEQKPKGEVCEDGSESEIEIEDEEGQGRVKDQKKSAKFRKEKKKKDKADINVMDEMKKESDSESEDDKREEKKLAKMKTTSQSDTEEDDEEFNIIEDDVSTNEIERELAEEIENELDDLDEDDDFWTDEDEADVVVGDGGDGGGVVLGGAAWGRNALELAERVLAESGSSLSLFAFKISQGGIIRVRLDKLSDRYGSPTMSDITNFSKSFLSALEVAGEAGSVPKDINVEVSSPGAERVVRVPEDLERFKDLPMYVQYVGSEAAGGDVEKDGVLELETLDVDAGLSIWKMANVKINRELQGKGRPLNSKQKKWRTEVPLRSLKQVRLYMDM